MKNITTEMNLFREISVFAWKKIADGNDTFDPDLENYFEKIERELLKCLALRRHQSLQKVIVSDLLNS